MQPSVLLLAAPVLWGFACRVVPVKAACQSAKAAAASSLNPFFVEVNRGWETITMAGVESHIRISVELSPSDIPSSLTAGGGATRSPDSPLVGGLLTINRSMNASIIILRGERIVWPLSDPCHLPAPPSGPASQDLPPEHRQISASTQASLAAAKGSPRPKGIAHMTTEVAGKESPSVVQRDASSGRAVLAIADGTGMECPWPLEQVAPSSSEHSGNENDEESQGSDATKSQSSDDSVAMKEAESFCSQEELYSTGDSQESIDGGRDYRSRQRRGEDEEDSSISSADSYAEWEGGIEQNGNSDNDQSCADTLPHPWLLCSKDEPLGRACHQPSAPSMTLRELISYHALHGQEELDRLLSHQQAEQSPPSADMPRGRKRSCSPNCIDSSPPSLNDACSVLSSRQKYPRVDQPLNTANHGKARGGAEHLVEGGNASYLGTLGQQQDSILATQMAGAAMHAPADAEEDETLKVEGGDVIFLTIQGLSVSATVGWSASGAVCEERKALHVPDGDAEGRHTKLTVSAPSRWLDFTIQQGIPDRATSPKGGLCKGAADDEEQSSRMFVHPSSNGPQGDSVYMTVRLNAPVEGLL